MAITSFLIRTRGRRRDWTCNEGKLFVFIWKRKVVEGTRVCHHHVFDSEECDEDNEGEGRERETGKRGGRGGEKMMD